jgi:hypothetical protein
MLKKALFERLRASAQILPASGIRQASSIPLTLLSSSPGVIYQSAIAQKLAAITQEDPGHILQQVASALQTPCLPEEVTALKITEAVPATSRGAPAPNTWIAFTVSSTAMTTWIERLQQLPLPITPNSEPPGSVLTLLQHQQWQLCQRLRLSLPMTLQWSQARCGFWLWEMGRAPNAGLAPPDRSGIASPATPELLRTLVYAVDTLAAQPEDPITFVRQGYAIAEAIYTFEARLPLSTVLTSPQPVRVEIVGLLQAVQRVLALILFTTLGQTPASEF